jgi:hypothetical protein
LALIDKRAAIRGHFNQRLHRQLPCGAVDALQFRRYGVDPLYRTVLALDGIARLRGPKAERFELLREMDVNLQEVARQRLSLEQVRDLRLDAFVTTRNRGDGRGGCDGNQQTIA